jgi:hypothetical protein
VTELQANICEAIESCEGTYLSADDECRISAEHGAEVARAARQLYDDTIGCPVDWSKANMDDGLGVLADVCHDQYPWLSEAVRLKLVHWFVMAWK